MWRFRIKSRRRPGVKILPLMATAPLILVGVFIVTARADRAYPLGCSQQPPSYYNYDSYPFPPPNVPIQTTDDYLLLRRLGAGKFSDVFEAVDVDLERRICPDKEKAQVDSRTLVVLKVCPKVDEHWLLANANIPITLCVPLTCTHLIMFTFAVPQANHGTKDPSRTAGTFTQLSSSQLGKVTCSRRSKVPAPIGPSVSSSDQGPAHAHSGALACRRRLTVVVSWTRQ